MYEEITDALRRAVRYLKEAAPLPEGALVVLGCSTSEVMGGRIGKMSAPEVGVALAEAMLAECAACGLRPAFQCCEHLNRAVLMAQDELARRGLTQVNVVPKPKAGGSVPAAAYPRMARPAMALSVQADAAIDVGDTLVGMHIRPVAVPLRLPEGEAHRVGQANLVMAYSRLPYIGGSRAEYR